MIDEFWGTMWEIGEFLEKVSKMWDTLEIALNSNRVLFLIVVRNLGCFFWTDILKI